MVNPIYFSISIPAYFFCYLRIQISNLLPFNRFLFILNTMTYVLFLLAACAGILLFDYYKTRDLARGRHLFKETKALREDMEHMQKRIEHLEAIVADQDFDLYSSTQEPKRKQLD